MNQMKLGLATLILGLSASLFTPQEGAAQENKANVRMRGATTVTSLVQPWVAEFEVKRPDVKIVLYGSTHGDGLKALLGGFADIAMTARSLSPEERKQAEQQGFNLLEDKICNDAVAIIVNKDNPVNELSLDQLRKVFSGAHSNWRELGGPDEPIVVVTLPPDSGMTLFLTKDVFKAPFPSTAVMKTSPRETPHMVAARKGAISFCRTDLAVGKGAQGQIKALSVKKDDSSPAVALSNQSVADGTFPIIRPLALCYDRDKGPAVARELGDFFRKKHDQTQQ